jgi:hypothetical protein
MNESWQDGSGKLCQTFELPVRDPWGRGKCLPKSTENGEKATGEWRHIRKREGLKGYNSRVFIGNRAGGRVWRQAQAGAGNDG